MPPSVMRRAMAQSPSSALLASHRLLFSCFNRVEHHTHTCIERSSMYRALFPFSSSSSWSSWLVHLWCFLHSYGRFLQLLVSFLVVVVLLFVIVKVMQEIRNHVSYRRVRSLSLPLSPWLCMVEMMMPRSYKHAFVVHVRAEMARVSVLLHAHQREGRSLSLLYLTTPARCS